MTKVTYPLNSVSESLRTWEAISHTELPHFGAPEKTAADLRAILPLLSLQDTVLDLGCGWGRITFELLRRGYDVTGVDLSPNLITYARSVAREQGIKGRFDVGSMLELPYQDASFDKLLCMWGAFNHLLNLEEQVQALNEMHRVLRPGGTSFIEMGNGESKRYRMTRQRDGFGPDKRVYIRKDNEIGNTLFIHDRGTLRNVAAQSAFHRCEVKFKNIDHKRRIVMLLHR